MWRRLILKDAIGIWTLVTACVIGGVLLNEGRAKPLTLIYSTPQARLDQSVTVLGKDLNSSVHGEEVVTLGEMQTISTGRTAVVLDARPEIFYRLGHIPTALSLPRDDFENRYRTLASLLGAHRDQQLIVYCSGIDCQDSQLVGDALERLGYSHVRLFRGGWSEWEGANLAEEKQ
jgi:3-mercaptopyruvate sulfurtransferase SseA